MEKSEGTGGKKIFVGRQAIECPGQPSLRGSGPDPVNITSITNEAGLQWVSLTVAVVVQSGQSESCILLPDILVLDAPPPSVSYFHQTGSFLKIYFPTLG